MRELISFELSNCAIEGAVDDDLDFMVRPGRQKTINVVRRDHRRPFKAQIVNNDYYISEVD